MSYIYLQVLAGVQYVLVYMYKLKLRISRDEKCSGCAGNNPFALYRSPGCQTLSNVFVCQESSKI